MKKILFLISLFVSVYAFGQDSSKVIYNEIRGNIWMLKHNVPAWQIDGINVAVRGSDTLVRVKGDGTYAAGDLQIYADGTDQTAKLNAVLNLSKVRAIKISADSSRPFVVNGSLDARGRTLIFENGAYITGTGAVSNAIVQASKYARIFDTSGLTITNILSASNVLTPQNFGAKGDGVTDDTKAVHKALSTANATIDFPNGTYLVKDSLSLHYTSNIDMAYNSLILSDIPENKKGIIIGSYMKADQPTMRGKYYKIRIEKASQSNWSDTLSIGVYAVNINYTNHLYIDHVRGFTIGVKTMGYDAGLVSVRHNLGFISNNMVGIWLGSASPNGLAWNNENTFYGGYITVSSSINTGKQAWGIWIGNGNYNNSSNTFYNTSIEFSRSNAVPIRIISGRRNRFMYLRSEGNSDTLMKVDYAADFGWNTMNKVFAGRDGATGKIFDYSQQKANDYGSAETEYSINTSYTTIYEVDNIVDRITYPDSDSTAHIVYPGFFTTRSGSRYPQDTSSIMKVDGDYVLINNTTDAGLATDIIDVSESKTFVIKQDIKPGTKTATVYVALYDSTLTQLGLEDTLGSNFSMLTTSNSYGARYYIPSPSRDLRIKVPDAAKYMRISFGRTSSGTAYLKGYKVIAYENNNNNTTRFFDGSAKVIYADAVPSKGNWSRGTIILNNNTGNSDAGWVVTSSGTFDTLQSRTASISSNTNKLRMSAGTGARVKPGNYINVSGDIMRVVSVVADTAYMTSTASSSRSNVAINFAVPKIAPLSGGTAVIDTNVVATQAGLTHVKDSILNLMVADTLTANFYQDGDTLRLYLGDKNWAVYNPATGGGGDPNTYTDGLTKSGNTVRNDLITGKSGGQTVVGGTASGNDLTLSSTTHATKGKIKFGANSYFDETNNVLHIGGTGGASSSGINMYKSLFRFYNEGGTAVRGWINAIDPSFTIQSNKNFFLGTKSVNYIRIDTLGRTLFSFDASSRFPLARVDMDSTDGSYASFRIAPGSEPSSKVPGAFWNDKSNNHVKVWDGIKWVDLMDGGGGSVDFITPSELDTLFAQNNIAAWGNSLTAGYPAYPFTERLSILSGRYIYNGGISGQTSTQIKNRMIADTAKFNWPAIIWAGRNNYSDSTSVVNDIAQMVDSLKHDRYIVLGIINGEYAAEYSGGASYSKIVNLNNYLSATYGSRFVPIRTYLTSLNTGVGQDATDATHDIVPASLRADAIHLNKAGYDTVARYIYDNYMQFLTYGNEKAVKAKDVIKIVQGNSSGQFNKSIRVLDGINEAFSVDAEQKVTTITAKTDYAAANGDDLVTNGNFASGMTGWTGTNWSDGGGKATHATGSTSPLTQTITPCVSCMYEVTMTMSGRTAGGVTLSIGGIEISNNSAAATTNQYASNGTLTGSFWGGEAFGSQTLAITPTTTFNGSVTDIKVTRVTSNLSNAINIAGHRLKVLGSNIALGGTNPMQWLSAGEYNLSISNDAFSKLTRGSYNGAFLSGALNNLTTGNYNIATGNNALSTLRGGYYNVAYGAGSLQSVYRGNNNSGFGTFSLSSVSGFSNGNSGFGFNAGTGTAGMVVHHNTFLGGYAGSGVANGATGNLNAGYKAGENVNGGSRNIILGYDIDLPTTGGSNQLNVGNAIFGTGINQAGTTMGGKIGIKVKTPQADFHVGGNIKIDTIPTGTPGTDSVLVVNDGVIKSIPANYYSTGGGGSGGDSITSIVKNASRDSIIFNFYDGRRIAVKDSVGQVSGYIGLSFTSTNTSTGFTVSLPISSNLGSASDLKGHITGGYSGSNVFVGMVRGEGSLDVAAINFTCSASSSDNATITFQYTVK